MKAKSFLCMVLVMTACTTYTMETHVKASSTGSSLLRTVLRVRACTTTVDLLRTREQRSGNIEDERETNQAGSSFGNLEEQKPRVRRAITKCGSDSALGRRVEYVPSEKRSMERPDTAGKSGIPLPTKQVTPQELIAWQQELGVLVATRIKNKDEVFLVAPVKIRREKSKLVPSSEEEE